MSRLLAALASLLGVLALVAAGCGSDEPESEAAADTTVTTTDTTATNSGPSESPASDSSETVAVLSEGFNARAIYESAAPGVVTVTSFFGGSNPATLFGGGGRGQGSGFVVSEEGEVLTNAHVVTDADQTGATAGSVNEAREVYVKFADLNQVEAEIVGVDLFSDVALLRIDPADLDLHALPLGSETDVAVGDPLVAIGSPFSQEQSLSLGIVSATDRSIPGLTGFQIEGALQTDASINPGNSGGPLLDAAGEVVGINQQINSTSGGNEGVGFSVPIDLAERSIEQLREDGEAEYAYIGVKTRALYPQLAEEMGLDAETGALLEEVIPDGPADDAGLVAGDEPFEFQGFRYRGGGDVITAVDGQELTGETDLPRIISLLNPGDVVTLDVLRDGEAEQVEVTLGERPGN